MPRRLAGDGPEHGQPAVGDRDDRCLHEHTVWWDRVRQPGARLRRSILTLRARRGVRARGRDVHAQRPLRAAGRRDLSVHGGRDGVGVARQRGRADEAEARPPDHACQHGERIARADPERRPCTEPTTRHIGHAARRRGARRRDTNAARPARVAAETTERRRARGLLRLLSGTSHRRRLGARRPPPLLSRRTPTPTSLTRLRTRSRCSRRPARPRFG